MSLTSEEIRELKNQSGRVDDPYISKLLKNAAETISVLSEKVSKQNFERSDRHYIKEEIIRRIKTEGWWNLEEKAGSDGCIAIVEEVFKEYEQ